MAEEEEEEEEEAEEEEASEGWRRGPGALPATQLKSARRAERLSVKSDGWLLPCATTMCPVVLSLLQTNHRASLPWPLPFPRALLLPGILAP